MATGEKVNLAKVFQENEEKQQAKLHVVEAEPTHKKKIALSREKKKHIGGISMKLSTDR